MSAACQVLITYIFNIFLIFFSHSKTELQHFRTVHIAEAAPVILIIVIAFDLTSGVVQRTHNVYLYNNSSEFFFAWQFEQ